MKHKNTLVQTFSLISQLGISMIVPAVLCTVLGAFLEKKFQIPVTIPFIILGVLAGARNVYVLVRQASKRIEEEKDEEE